MFIRFVLPLPLAGEHARMSSSSSVTFQFSHSVFSIISLESFISKSFHSSEILHFTYPYYFRKISFLRDPTV